LSLKLGGAWRGEPAGPQFFHKSLLNFAGASQGDYTVAGMNFSEERPLQMPYRDDIRKKRSNLSRNRLDALGCWSDLRQVLGKLIKRIDFFATIGLGSGLFYMTPSNPLAFSWRKSLFSLHSGMLGYLFPPKSGPLPCF
jgi:hypothetical protein